MPRHAGCCLRQKPAYGLPHVIGIEHPDSRRPPNALEGFTSVTDFDRVVPPKPAT